MMYSCSASSAFSRSTFSGSESLLVRRSVPAAASTTASTIDFEAAAIQSRIGNGTHNSEKKLVPIWIVSTVCCFPGSFVVTVVHG
jgi:hypothetical protein